MIRVHYYVHGRGRGHATRSRAIIAGLRSAAVQVSVFAGRDAQSVFGNDCRPVQSVPPGLPLGLGSLLLRRIKEAEQLAARDMPQLILSDGDLPAVAAGKRLGLPTLAIGHGLVFAHCERPLSAPRLPWLREGVKARLASAGASHQVAVNFVPLKPRDPERTSVAFPSVQALPQVAEPGCGPVVCYFRDDNGAQFARWAMAAGYPVCTFGGRPVEGAKHLPFAVSAFQEALGAARAVISSAGSQLISECLFHGVPQLALYHPRDDEQRLNACMLSSCAGPSRGLASDACDATAVAAFLADCDPTQRWADAPGGAEQRVNVVDEVVRQTLRLAG